MLVDMLASAYTIEELFWIIQYFLQLAKSMYKRMLRPCLTGVQMDWLMYSSTSLVVEDEWECWSMPNNISCIPLVILIFGKLIYSLPSLQVTIKVCGLDAFFRHMQTFSLCFFSEETKWLPANQSLHYQINCIFPSKSKSSQY